jgi:hypothetical protein
MTDHTVITSGDGPVVLESDVPLASSVIWGLQRDFYVQRGLKAWTEDQVPSYITNNPFIAEIYAAIVAGYLADCMELAQQDSRPLSPQSPLRILELGAGTGKFAYLFLRKITALLQEKNIEPRLLRYCMTDCSEDLLAEWRSNQYLAGFLSSGILEFKLLRAESNEDQQVSASEIKTPLVVIANYVFDSLPQDAFVIAAGQISEALLTTVASGGQDGRIASLSSLQLSFNNVPVAPDRYADKSWNAILEHYRGRLSAATVLFPSAAINLLQQLSKASDGRMLLLAADKAIAHEEDLQLYQGPPSIEFHGPGCFSQMVNFDAIGKYFVGLGGKALKPEKHSAGLGICAFLQLRPGDEFPGTASAYRDAMAAFGPDDLFALLAWLHPHMEQMSIPQILALLRLTRWDTTAFLRLFPVIARQLRSVGAERADLRNAVLSTWANHYPVGAAENVLAFNCGVILLELRFFPEALAMFKTSEQTLGRSAATSFNLGLCALGLDHSADALDYMVDACNLDPAFEPARSSRLKLEQEKLHSGKTKS